MLRKIAKNNTKEDWRTWLSRKNNT